VNQGRLGHVETPPEWDSVLSQFPLSPRLPLLNSLSRRSFWLWLAASIFWLLRGWWWREGGSVPNLPQVLEQVGISLWLLGGALSPALEQQLHHANRHSRQSPARLLEPQFWLGVVRGTESLLLAGLVVATAALGALLPFEAAGELVFAASQDQLEFFVRILPFGLMVICLGGCLALCLSATLQSLLRSVLGATLGSGAWLLLIAFVHQRLFAGGNFISGFVGRPDALIERFPLSLGSQSVRLLQTLSADGNPPYYAIELIWRLALFVLIPLCGLIVAFALLSAFYRWRGQARLFPLLVLAGCVAPLLAMLPQLEGWLSGATTSPGDWRSYFTLGMGAVWIVLSLGLWPMGLPARAQPWGLAWYALCICMPSYWLLLSWPAVAGGTEGQSVVLAYGLLAMLLFATGVCALFCGQRLLGGWWALTAIPAYLVIPIAMLQPVNANGNLAAALLTSLAPILIAPDSRPQAAVLLACLLLAPVLLLTLTSARRLPKRKPASRALPPLAG
jgi:hypothetical protein